MQEGQNISIEEFEQHPDVVVIKLGENVQGGNEALEFSTKLHELSSGNIKYVILDLQNVKLMNSSGLGMLVGGLNTLQKNNIRMVLANMPEKIMNLLKMTHLDQVMHTFGSVEEALKNYR